MWMDKTIYFLSDRNGEFNLFSYNTDTKAIIQLTQYSDFPINSANATGKNIIFEQAGKLHIFPIKQASISFISVHRMAKVNRALTRLPAPGFMLFRSGHPTVNSLPSAITDATFIYSMLLQEPSKKLIQTNFMFPGRFVIFLAIGQPIRAGSHTQKLLQLISNRFLFILLNRENHFLLPMD
jgi:hypothetical protein